MKYKAIFYRARNGVAVFFPELKIATSGRDLDHARQMALELRKYYNAGQIKPVSLAQINKFANAEVICMEIVEV